MEHEKNQTEITYPTLTIDYALYDKHLKEWDATPEQKQEFIDTLWQMIVALVDLGIGIHPVQQVLLETSGQNQETSPDLTPELTNLLNCMDCPTPENLQITNAFNRDEEEGVET